MKPIHENHFQEKYNTIIYSHKKGGPELASGFHRHYRERRDRHLAWSLGGTLGPSITLNYLRPVTYYHETILF